MSKIIPPPRAPLADRMRPTNLSEMSGQEKVLGEESFLRDVIRKDIVPSLILWGPPGCGKTTLARIIASETSAEFLELSGVGSGIGELRKAILLAEKNREAGQRTILFIDEIHRWNKGQQDSLLPHVEEGLITLIGATTENPSFEVNASLLSRTRVVVLGKLESEAVSDILSRAVVDNRGLKEENLEIDQEALRFIAEVSGGDARHALNILEACSGSTQKITMELVGKTVGRSHILYDKRGEQHYDVISALHKSLRGGDADAGLYWLGRMLEAGEDPLYVARRLIRFASEDIGIANSFALPQAVAAYDACRFIGMPECELALAQAVVYLAKSKKSNALYAGYAQVKKDVHSFPNEAVPLHLRNAPTKLMKNLGYGKGYKYTPNFQDPDEAKQEYLPAKLKGRRYIPPVES